MKSYAKLNGFTVSNCKTMEGRDGYVLSCDLSLEGKKIAHCFDGGDGAGMDIDFCMDIDRAKINQLVKSMCDEPEYIEFYELDSVVCRLMDMTDTIKAFQRAQKKGAFLVIVKFKRRVSRTYSVPGSFTEDSARKDIMKSMTNDEKTDLEDIRFYRTENDFIVNDHPVHLADVLR